MEDVNNNYWATVDSHQIMGGTNFPGPELYSLLKPNSQVIDIGCGNGETSHDLSRHGMIVTGVDINQEAIENNSKKYPKVSFVQGNILQSLPFEDNTFEAAVISYVLVSVLDQKDRDALILELQRILKPGGLVWLKEGLVSKDYTKRYELARPFLEGMHGNHNGHAFLVLKDKAIDYNMLDQQSLRQIVDSDGIERIACHYTIEEIKELFQNYKQVSFDLVSTTSPKTGMTIESCIAVFRKK